MAVCKKCGCAIPIGQKNCDICGPLTSSAASQPWQPPVEPIRRASPAPVAPAAPAAWSSPSASQPPSELPLTSQPIWFQPSLAQAVPAQSAPKAGFWMRFLALMIDSIFIGLPGYALARVVLNGSYSTVFGIDFLIELLYFTYYWSRYGSGQTIGMQVLHMKVVKTDGSLLTPTAAFIRFVGFVVASIPFDLGLIWAGIDGQKQGWHDKIAGTYVVSNW